MLQFQRPFTNGMNASGVIGQPDFTSSFSAAAQNRFLVVLGDVLDKSGNLYVADTDRIMQFQPPFTDGMNASIVFGQPDFTTLNEGPATPNGLYREADAATDSKGNLWVADTWHSRILEFTPPFSTNMNASLVLGQTSFTSNLGGTAQNLFLDPNAVAFDSADNLYVVDWGNNRVLIFRPPFSTNMNASVVIGAPDFTTKLPPTVSQNAFGQAEGVAADEAGNLYVSDSNNNRILQFVPPFTDGMNAAVVIGQKDFVSVTFPDPPTQSTLNRPFGISFGPSSCQAACPINLRSDCASAPKRLAACSFSTGPRVAEEKNIQRSGANQDREIPHQIPPHLRSRRRADSETSAVDRYSPRQRPRNRSRVKRDPNQQCEGTRAPMPSGDQRQP